jgi:hypothetical protein
MASKAVGVLTFNFGANLGGFDRAMKKSQKKLKKFGNNVKKIGSSLTTNLTLPIAALGAVSVKAFDQQAKAEMKLLTALKGREDIQNRLIEQAKELQKTTLFGDEATIESQALLASLGLTEEQILMLMPQIQNMATALGMDLTAATSLVSKSVSTSTDALARYFDTGLKGVTGQQERAIVLTGALTEKFDGQSEAAAKVGAGPLIQMKNQLGDLTEQLGEKLMPFVIKFVGWLTKLIDKFDSLSSTQIENIVKWGLVLAAIGPVLLIVGKAILIYGQFKIAIAAVNAFMLANPFVAVAAGIAVLVAGIYNLVKAFTFQVDVQKELKDLNHDAQKSVASDLVNIDLLTGAIKSETTSLEDKKKALNELKSTYPGYYDQIDEATFSSDMLKQSTDRLKESLINVAKVTAYKDKLTEIQRKIIDLEETGNVDISTSLGVDVLTQNISGPLAPVVKVLDASTGMFANFKQNIQENIDTREITELTKLTDELTNKIADLNKTTSDIAPVTKITHTTTNEEVETPKSSGSGSSSSDRQVKSIEAISLATKELKFELKEYNTEIAKSKPLEEVFDIEPVNKYREVFGFFGGEIADFFGTTLPELESGLESMVNKLGDNLAQGAETFEEFGKSVLGVLRDVIGGLISQGIAAAIANALKDSFLPVWAIPVVAGAAAGLARTAFNSLIPQFAEGGLVTGPTLGLIGEGAGTNAGNPEVVAPLDKLKSMIGGGNQNIVVEGKLAGNDIFLSNARTKFNRNRTV